MANLNDKLIREAYKGLIKTSDEAAISSTPKTLQDGEGNNLPVAVGTTSMVYSGTQDFSGATVLGISGGGGGGATYDLTSEQDGDAINIKLTGSDASVDTVQIIPGLNITLTDYGGNQFAIEAAGGGGGGGSTPPMSIGQLPPWKTQITTGVTSFRTWVVTSGYTVQNGFTLTGANAYASVFPMAEGQLINRIRISVGTATAGANIKGAIYRVGTDADGLMILTDKLYDIPTVSGATTGVKDIDITSSPFTMPAGETWGAVGIVFSSDINGPALRCWSQGISGVWTGNGGGFGGAVGETWYRAVGWYITAGLAEGAFPDDASSLSYGSATSNPLYIGIQ